LSNPELLRDLKELVTLEPKGQVRSATGIPPHIEHATMAKKILHLCEMTLLVVKDMATSVKEAFEEKAEENGQVLGERLKTMFEEHKKNVAELINSKLSELRESFPIALAQEQDVGGNDDTMPFAEGDDDEVLVEQPNQVPTQVIYQTYMHGGWHWHVPKDFAFPTGVRLDTGWKMWIVGLPGNETIGN